MGTETGFLAAAEGRILKVFHELHRLTRKGVVEGWFASFAEGVSSLSWSHFASDFMHLNVARKAAEISHALALATLLYILCCSRSAAGLSLRTQEIYLLVFALRYQDLAWNFISSFNFIYKVFLLSVTLFVVIACHCVPALRRSRNPNAEMRPRTVFLLMVLPALVLGYVFSADRSSPFENGWTTSVLLETVASVPQMVLMVREASCRSAVSHYIFLLASYRALYIVNWVWRYLHEIGYWWPVVWVAGTVQTALYLPFFVIYCRAKLCCMRPHASVELIETHSLLCAEDSQSARSGPALAVEQCKFACPKCGRELQYNLKVGQLITVRCQCGEAFQVNLEPPSAAEEAARAAQASAECFSFSAASAHVV